MRRVAVCIALAGCYRAPEQCDLDVSLSCESKNATADAYDFWPFVVETFPPDNAKLVPLGITPTVRFTEQVTGVSSTSFVLAPMTTTTPIAAAVDYDVATRRAALHPNALLEPSTQYVATLTADIVDLTGNTLYGKRTWTFKTIHDTTSPSVMATSPADGATDVPVEVVIVAEFTEQVSHITNASFYVEGVSGSIGYVSQTAVKVTPRFQLEPYTQYTATLTDAITDLIGNPLVGAPVTWSFTTGADTLAPHVVKRIPTPDETDVSITAKVVVQFDETVFDVEANMTLEHDGVPLAATVTYQAHTRLWWLAATLAPETTYTVKLGAGIRDASGNQIAPVSWTFTTTDL